MRKSRTEPSPASLSQNKWDVEYEGKDAVGTLRGR